MIFAHRRRGGFAGSIFAIPLVLLVAGCGDGPPAGTVSINGVVTLDGKPIEGATLAFVGNQGARLSTAQTDATGSFTAHVALGKNAVGVAKDSSENIVAPVSDEPMLMPSDGEYQKMAVERKTDIPSKYADPKTSGLAIEVAEGMQSVELALSSS